jgi:hypothetical protein
MNLPTSALDPPEKKKRLGDKQDAKEGEPRPKVDADQDSENEEATHSEGEEEEEELEWSSNLETAVQQARPRDMEDIRIPMNPDTLHDRLGIDPLFFPGGSIVVDDDREEGLIAGDGLVTPEMEGILEEIRDFYDTVTEMDRKWRALEKRFMDIRDRALAGRERDAPGWVARAQKHVQGWVNAHKRFKR